MSNDTLDRLRSELLSLPEAERAELARDLIRSLDAPADEGVEEAWDREIARRIEQIEAGQATLLSREELRRRMMARLGRQ